MNRSFIATSTFLLVSVFAICQPTPKTADCSTLKYLRHKVSCLCGIVQICSGDICLSPSNYNLDEDITVELRDKTGTTILDSKKVTPQTHERECTTQTGAKTSCNTTEKSFCFEGKRNGEYQLAFVLHKNGNPQPAVKFPTSYSRKQSKPCDSIYMVEPTCPVTCSGGKHG